MAGVIENYCKFEFHVLIKFLQAEGLSQQDSSQASECFQPK
jgi:hypothetical protein